VEELQESWESLKVTSTSQGRSMLFLIFSKKQKTYRLSHGYEDASKKAVVSVHLFLYIIYLDDQLI
jgi:hypothetical protein